MFLRKKESTIKKCFLINKLPLEAESPKPGLEISNNLTEEEDCREKESERGRGVRGGEAGERN